MENKHKIKSNQYNKKFASSFIVDLFTKNLSLSNVKSWIVFSYESLLVSKGIGMSFFYYHNMYMYIKLQCIVNADEW
jgi:hypothetical protein